ncbi:MAG TPA: hypothetical protein VHE37_09200, partial [Nevskiaceae bacterium]|nr:hypothetical protein [Nevskiaceae bacterium]
MKARSLCLLAGLFLAAAVPAQAALTFTQSAGGPQSSAGDLYPRGDGAIYSLLSDRVYKSTDGGSNWSLLGGAPPERASMLAFAGTDLYAAGVFGVLRSTDDGVTWNDFNGSADTALPFTTVYQLYSTGSFLFAVGQDDNFNPLVYRSAVGGASWSNVTPPGIGSNQVNSGAVTGSTLCLSVTNSGIRYTANGGDSWSSSSGVSGNIPFVAASPAAAGTVYASNSGGGMFRSTNSCGAFSGIGSALTGVTGGLVTRLGVDASAHVYVASADGNVRMSSNPASSAATYDLINGGSLPADTQVPVLGFAPVSGGIVAGSTGLGLNFSDGTSNWTRRGNGLKGGAISALMSGPGTSIALTAGGVLSTSDSGATYTEDNNGLVLRNTGAIVRKGNTWLVAAFQPSNGSGTAPPGLYRSTDAGATWTQLLAASGLPAGAGIGD